MTVAPAVLMSCLLSISGKGCQCVMKRSVRMACELPWERRGNHVRQWKLLLSHCPTYICLLQSRLKPNSVWIHLEAFSGHLRERYQSYIWSVLPKKLLIFETAFPSFKASFASFDIKVVSKAIEGFCVCVLVFSHRRLFSLKQSLQLIEINSFQNSGDHTALRWVSKEELRCSRNFFSRWSQRSLFSDSFLPKLAFL